MRNESVDWDRVETIKRAILLRDLCGLRISHHSLRSFPAARSDICQNFSNDTHGHHGQTEEDVDARIQPICRTPVQGFPVRSDFTGFSLKTC